MNKLREINIKAAESLIAETKKADEEMAKLPGPADMFSFCEKVLKAGKETRHGTLANISLIIVLLALTDPGRLENIICYTIQGLESRYGINAEDNLSGVLNEKGERVPISDLLNTEEGERGNGKVKEA